MSVDIKSSSEALVKSFTVVLDEDKLINDPDLLKLVDVIGSLKSVIDVQLEKVNIIDYVARKRAEEEIKQHLKDFENKKDEAFSAEGILVLNKKLAEKKRFNEWSRKNQKKRKYLPL